jgi:hypothetical protein
VKQQSFLIGKSRPLRAATGFRSHFNSLMKRFGGRAWGASRR